MVDTFLDAEDMQESIDAGFPGTWLVYENYEIKDGNVVGTGLLSEGRWYRPITHRELPSVLAKVDPLDEQQILDFVRTYGVLGGSPQDDRSWQSAEPLSWIRQQIKTVRLLLELVKCSLDNDDQAASKLYSEADRQNGTFRGISLSTFVIRTDQYDVPSGMTADTALGWVRYVACAIINSNIQGVTRKATLLQNGNGIKSYFHFSSLLDVVYWQILNALEGGELKRCQSCQTPFISTDGRQRFCPKRYGESESRCAIAFRQRQYRERHGI